MATDQANSMVGEETPAQRIQVLAARVRDWCTDDRFSSGDCAAAIGSAIVALEVAMFPDEAAKADRRIAQRNLAVLENRVRVASDFIRNRNGERRTVQFSLPFAQTGDEP